MATSKPLGHAAGENEAQESEVTLTDADFELARELPLDKSLAPAGDEYDSGKFEGDIAGVILSTSGELLATDDGDGEEPKNALVDRSRLWPDGIVPYAIDSRYNASSRAVIAAALHELHGATCVTFVPRNAAVHASYVYMTPLSGCWSYFGRIGGRQIVSLAMNKCVHKRIVEHELLHALGFMHEQSRTDRDEHVEILWANIKAGKEKNFLKYPNTLITDMETDYNYGSIMHYRAKSFSRNGLPTIRAKESGVHLGVASNSAGLTDVDALKVNRLYRCCDTPPPAGALRAGAEKPLGLRLRSANGRYEAALRRGDGDLVLYEVANGKILWSSGTAHKGVRLLSVRADGRLALHDRSYNAVWSAGGTGGSRCTGTATLLVEDGGELAVRDCNGVVSWRSGGGGR